MHKGTMMGLCLMAVLGAVVLEVNASPDTDVLPAELLLNEVSNTSDFIIELTKNLQHHCEKVTGEAHSRVIGEAMKKLIHCFGETMENLDQHKTFYTFIPPFCKKAPEFGACVMEFTTKIQVCLTAEEKRRTEKIAQIGASLWQFACSNGGDQITLFMANKGPQCLKAKMDGINNCGDKYLPIPDQKGALALLDSPTFCVDLEQFESCVLDHLEQCSNMTPANIVQSIFTWVKSKKDCQDQNPGGFWGTPGGLPKWIVAAAIFGVAIFILIFYFLFCK